MNLKLDDLNLRIFKLKELLKEDLSSERRTELEQRLTDAEYDRSALFIEGQRMLKKNTEGRFDCQTLLDRMIFDGIIGTIRWIIEKKNNGKPKRFEDSVVWIMDIVPPNEKKEGLTFEGCCESLDINAENIRRCLLIMSRKEVDEIKKVLYIIEKNPELKNCEPEEFKEEGSLYLGFQEFTHYQIEKKLALSGSPL